MDIMVKLLKIKNKDMILKTSREKQHITNTHKKATKSSDM